jgi:hypothetical protein
MIQEVERYHGIALARVVRGDENGHHIRNHESVRSAYVLDGSVGLYVKYSTSRLSPWSFSFSEGHRREMAGLALELGRVCLALVCGEDGVVALTGPEMAVVLGADAQGDGWVRVDRRRSQMYGVSGSAGRLRVKVADSSFSRKVLGAPVPTETEMSPSP